MPQVKQDLQNYKLRNTLVAAKVTEGATVRVDAEMVHMTPIGQHPQLQGVQMVWCHTQQRRVTEVIQPGNGGEVSDTASYDLEVPAPGWYNVTDLLVHTNGTMHVYADEKTKLTPVAEPA